MSTDNPKVFISYSWEDEEHKKWVKQFAEQLIGDGIDAIIDQYDLTLGDRLPEFMEKSISASEYVLVICTPQYKAKSDARVGGVGYEGHIISGELFTKNNEHKFIPVIRKGDNKTATPLSLSGKLSIDMSNGESQHENYQDLIATLYGSKGTKPPLGKKPNYIKSTSKLSPHVLGEYEEIKIMGIITTKVTLPKMDGTRGSALYSIPFKLSKRPSTLWREIFLHTWKNPPRWSTMHRSKIAEVYGDEIVLNGTTIEEVKQYHRETLILCVNEANKNEKEILDKVQKEKEEEIKKKEMHYSNIESIANEIEF